MYFRAPPRKDSAVVFIGYTLDNKLRAFDLQTGKTLWKTDIPAPAAICYEIGGEQYVVVPAGGHSLFSQDHSDAVLAYKLKH